MSYNSGDVASGATSVIFEADIEKNGTWLRLCVDSLSEAMNLATVEWANLCNGGQTSSAVTGVAPSWSFDSHIYYNSSIADLLKQRYVPGYTALQNVPIRITNLLLDEQVVFRGLIVVDSITMNAADLQTMSGTVSVFNSVVNPRYVDPGTYQNVIINVVGPEGLGEDGMICVISDTNGNTFSGVTGGTGQATIPFIPFGDYTFNISNIPEGMTISGDTSISITATDSAVFTFELTAATEPETGDLTPSAIQTLTATPGDSEVTLTWAAPETNASSVSGYSIWGGIDGAPQSQLAVVDASTLTYIATDLTNGTLYDFTVYAQVNGLEVGATSAYVSATPNAVSVVQDLAVTAGSGSLDITWTAPATGASELTGYSVYVFPATEARPTTPTTTVGSSVLTYTATDLNQGVLYQVDVMAQQNGNDLTNTVATITGTPTA